MKTLLLYAPFDHCKDESANYSLTDTAVLDHVKVYCNIYNTICLLSQCFILFWQWLILKNTKWGENREGSNLKRKWKRPHSFCVICLWFTFLLFLSKEWWREEKERLPNNNYSGEPVRSNSLMFWVCFTFSVCINALHFWNVFVRVVSANNFTCCQGMAVPGIEIYTKLFFYLYKHYGDPKSSCYCY